MYNRTNSSGYFVVSLYLAHVVRGFTLFIVFHGAGGRSVLGILIRLVPIVTRVIGTCGGTLADRELLLDLL